MVDDAPTQVSIRTDNGNEWRYGCIQRAADFYGVNRSNAVAFACEDVSSIAAAVEEVLQREDLTDKQSREIAERFDQAARGLSIHTEREVDVGTEE